MKKKRSSAGAALVEFILVIPIFLAMVAGLIDSSILLYNKTIITHGSREGARYGVIIRSDGYAISDDLQAHTIEYCSDKLMSFGSPPSVTVSLIAPESGDPEFGDVLSVTVDSQFNGLIQQYSISSTTVMSYE